MRQQSDNRAGAWEFGKFDFVIIPEFYKAIAFRRSPNDLPERIAFLETALGQVLAVTLLLAKRPTAGSGSRPGDPNPDLLTEDEAIRYLKLDTIDIKNPEETLQRYRKKGHLKGTQVSKRVFYLRNELDGFLKKMTDINPR